ncbi:DUF2177 family protein [Candidatus Peribacteria bacterium]|nr:MAG: DUF2177 family protein [Candidatus Peribacteria bacterium]
MFFKLFAIALPVFLAIDMLWLGVIARNFYKQQIGSLLKDDVNWMAALIFYVIFLCGLIVFVIQPAMDKKSWMDALKFGALFGLVTYATYDLTNLAVAKNWPLPVTIVDLIWGTVLSASVATLTYIIAQKIG